MAAPSTYWASVVQGTTNTILNLDLPASVLAGVEWKIADADTERVDISPKTFTTTTTKLTLTGSETGSNVPEQATLSLVPLGSNGPAILTLKVWVLPQREMKLAIYTLEDPDSPETQFASSPAIPVPSDEAFLEVFNDSFRQAGVHFTLHPDRGVRARFHRYDTFGMAPWGTTGIFRYDPLLPARTNPDGILTADESTALLDTFDGAPAPALTSILPAETFASDTIRVLLLKDSGLPYDSSNVSGAKIRGGNRESVLRGAYVFLKNSDPHGALVAAHETGHVLSLYHAPSPFAQAISADLPNNQSPAFPTDTRYPSKTKPNVALMQAGALDDGLP